MISKRYYFWNCYRTYYVNICLKTVRNKFKNKPRLVCAFARVVKWFEIFNYFIVFWHGIDNFIRFSNATNRLKWIFWTFLMSLFVQFVTYVKHLVSFFWILKPYPNDANTLCVLIETSEIVNNLSFYFIWIAQTIVLINFPIITHPHILVAY